MKLLNDNPVMAERAADAMWSVRQLPEALSSESEEAGDLFERLPASGTPGEYEMRLSLSVLAQATLGLAERQAELLERIEHLEAEQK
jgi:hypothetical protein